MRQPEKRAAKSSLKARLALLGCFGVRAVEKRMRFAMESAAAFRSVKTVAAGSLKSAPNPFRLPLQDKAA